MPIADTPSNKCVSFFIFLTLRLPLFCCLLIFFKFNLKKKKKESGIRLECQTVWVQIRPDNNVCWVQTVCQIYRKTTFGDKELKAHQRIGISFESFRRFTRNIQCLYALFGQRNFFFRGLTR